MNKETLIYLTLDDFKNSEDIILNSISKERREKSSKYHQKEDRIRSLLASYLLKYTGKSQLKYTNLNKPYKDDCFFSITHSENYVFIYISSSDCGIDIEKKKEVNPKVINYSLSDLEKEIFNLNNEDFLYIWTRKESFSKCIGEGMYNNICIKDIPSNNGENIYKGNKYYSFSLDFDDYIVSITKKDKLNNIYIYKGRIDDSIDVEELELIKKVEISQN